MRTQKSNEKIVYTKKYIDELEWVIHPLNDKTPIEGQWNSKITIKNCKAYLDRHPGANNIGLLTGSKSGVIVLDCDVLKNKDDPFKQADGVIEINKLFNKHGGEPQTVKAISGGGGCHYYFKYDDNTKKLKGGTVKNTTKTEKKIKWDLLLDSSNGTSQNVVLPPSIHPDTHVKYKWERSPFEYDILEMPEWLLNILLQPLVKIPSKSKNSNDEKDIPEFTKQEVEKLVAMLSDDRRTSGSYNEWINIGIFLKGCSLELDLRTKLHKNEIIDTDQDFFEIWDFWSSDGDGYDEKICEDNWKGFKIKKLGQYFINLCSKAKEDNLDEFKEFMSKRKVNIALGATLMNSSIVNEEKEIVLTDTIISNLFLDELGHSKILKEVFADTVVCLDATRGNGYFLSKIDALWLPYDEPILFFHALEALRCICSTYKNQIMNDKNLSDETKKEKDKSITKILQRTWKKSHAHAVCTLLRAQIYNGRFYETLNNTRHILSIKDGLVVNLKTGKTRPRTKADKFTFECPVSIGDGSNLSYIEEFMNDIMGGNKDHVLYLQTLCGLFLTGEVSDRMIFIFWGEGSNGKSVLMEIIMKILGDFYTPVCKEVFIQNKGSDRNSVAGAHTSHLIQTIGKRVGSYSETRKGDKLNEGLIKALTGRDPISARAPYGKHNISFCSFMKPVLLTNFKPTFDTKDAAIVDRIRYIPFVSRFVDNPKMPNEKQKDSLKVTKILNEYLDDAFLWMLQGAMRYYNEGLKVPESLETEKKKYVQEMDPVHQFIEEKLVYGKEAKGQTIKATDCYTRFRDWCSENEDFNIISNKEFIASLRTKGFTTKLVQRAVWIESCGISE